MSAWEGLSLGALVLLALTLAVTAGTAAIAAAAEVLQYAWDRQRERRRRNDITIRAKRDRLYAEDPGRSTGSGPVTTRRMTAEDYRHLFDLKRRRKAGWNGISKGTT